MKKLYPMFFLRDLIFIRTVGEGSFGRVVKVQVKNKSGIQKHCALKLIKKNILNEPKGIDYILNEIDIYNDIEGCIFFPRLYSTFYARDRFCLLTDYCEGGEMLSLIRRLNGLSYEQIRFYGAEILLALKHLHDKNILYRDLKSENILLTKEGHIKLIDFGLSIKTDIPVNDRAGTVECMAPEVITQQFYWKEADYWSLGILLYEMFFKETPFKDKTKELTEENILYKAANLFGIDKYEFFDLLSSLLQKDRTKRLGYKNGILEIMNHSFFKYVDWHAIMNLKFKPPVNCQVFCCGENYPFYRESICSLFPVLS